MSAIDSLREEREAETLVGVHEIAEAIGVTKQVVVNWKARYPSFPKPIAELRMGPIWQWGPIKAWALKSQSGRIRLDPRDPLRARGPDPEGPHSQEGTPSPGDAERDAQ